MAYTLEEFCRDAREALKAQSGPAGREQVRQKLERLLAEPDFVEATCGASAQPGRHLLYRDPELDFCVLAHINTKANRSPPHDHGSSWAVYGQAVAHTDMTEWRRLDDGSDPKAAKLEEAKTYRLTPGKAGLFDVGAIHSIDFPDGARFVRVTGTDLDEVQRLRFDLEKGTAETIASASAS